MYKITLQNQQFGYNPDILLHLGITSHYTMYNFSELPIVKDTPIVP